jgi:hypothetical protein
VALVLVPAGFGEVISAVLRTRWGLLLNIPYVITRVWAQLLRVQDVRFGGRPLDGLDIPTVAAWIVLAAVCAVSVLLLNKRIQARQVVRG